MEKGLEFESLLLRLEFCVNLFVRCFVQTVACRPIASLDHFLPENLGNAGLVEEVPMGASKVVKVSRGESPPEQC